ncbi:glycosyltransferase [Halopiger djelfimassiliensis]|uniref:glycosyltransferase n=1 Tax=Halopiger djelfimassiliensis TaxID=1293047 RepID=UPI000677CEA2|nr:glycosyltransferase [Halopiger djelfimassiliensis]
MSQLRPLLIGYNYPPGGGIGSIRISKFAKYLPEPWDVHVLTAAGNAGPQTDAAVDDGGNATIHRVSEVWPTAPKDFDKIRWMPPLCREIRRLHREIDFDVIWHTAGPFLPLTAALFVSPMLRIPYVADFRDAWTLQPYTPERTVFGHVNDAVSSLAEPRVLRTATAVTTATDGITDAYRDQYPSLSSKFRTIANGYDPADFPDHDVESPSRFTIVYAGKFGHYRDVTPFVRALSNVKPEGDVRFLHVGKPEPAVRSAVDRFGLADRFECTGFVDRSEVARRIQRADVGLAVSGGSPQEMTTKIFDYIACKTPILACGPPTGSMANVVSRFEHGYVARNRTDEITKALGRLLETRPRALGPGPYDEYTRERSAERLAELFRRTI